MTLSPATAQVPGTQPPLYTPTQQARPITPPTGFIIVPNPDGGVDIYMPGQVPKAPRAPQGPARPGSSIPAPTQVADASGVTVGRPTGPTTQGLQTAPPTAPTPEQGGFQAAAGAQQDPALAAALAAKASPQQPPAPTSAPATTASVPPPPQGQQQGWLSRQLGLPEGTGDSISDAFAGMAGVSGRASPLAAAAQGFSGAKQNQMAREDRKRALVEHDADRAMAADDRNYQRGRDTVADKRADATDAYQHGRDTISDKRADRAATLQENEDKRAEAAAPYQRLNIESEIDTRQRSVKLAERAAEAEGVTKKDLDFADQFTLDSITERAKQMQQHNNFTGEVEPLTPDQQKELEAYGRKVHDDVLNQRRALSHESEGGVSTPPKTQDRLQNADPQEAPDTTVPGDGASYNAPVIFPQGMSPSEISQQAANILKPGQYFYDPFSKQTRVYQPTTATA